MKKAVGKSTDPGRHQVWRHAEGRDTIALADELVPGARPLLERYMALGAVTRALPSLPEIRERALAQVAALPAEIRAIRDPKPADVRRSRKLWDLRDQLGDPDAAAQLAALPADRDPVIRNWETVAAPAAAA